MRFLKSLCLPVFALLAFLLATSAPARADALVYHPTDNITCSPVGMLTGYQYNASTKQFQKGVAIGAGGGCLYTGLSVPLALNLVGGAGINDNAPNAAQGSLVFSVADNYGLGGGLQTFKDPVSHERQYQALLSFFLGASWAATIEQLSTAKTTAAKAATSIKLTTGDF